MILDRQRKYGSYKMGRALDNFLAAPYGIEVSTDAFHTVSEPYENSWGTMVNLRTPRNSAAKEISSSHFRTLSQGSSTKWIVRSPGIGLTCALSVCTNH